MNHRKVRNQPSKLVLAGDQVGDLVEETLTEVAQIVGSTLGPGGRPVLIERQETGLPASLSKDGVTVYRALGYDHPAKDAIMEVERDAAVRTANEAGDGTTSATILASALVCKTRAFCRSAPTLSPQRLMRRTASLLSGPGADHLLGLAVAPAPDPVTGKYSDADRHLLRSVAWVSANGDEELARAAVQAVVDIAGDFGNVIITEAAGPSAVTASQVPGYSFSVGWEDSCGHLAANWINDPASQRCVLESPRVICWNGKLTQTSSIMPLIKRLDDEFQAKSEDDPNVLLGLAVREGQVPAPICGGREHNAQTCGKPLSWNGSTWVCTATKGPVDFSPQRLSEKGRKAFDAYRESIGRSFVLVAPSFGPAVLNDLMLNFGGAGMKIFPLRLPIGPTPAFQAQILADVAAMAGAKVLDPVKVGTNNFSLSDVGPGVLGFEARRTSSSLLGRATDLAWSDEQAASCRALLAKRLEEVEKQRKSAVSEMDRGIVAERLAKLAGGLAQVLVTGSSNSEIRERKDRVEDAVCAVRGAIRAGTLPGGGWGLLALESFLRSCATTDEDRTIVERIIAPALRAPIEVLYHNAGQTDKQRDQAVAEMVRSVEERGDGRAPRTFDLVKAEMVDAYEHGLLDSAPAVVEAVRSAASIALNLGVMGGLIVYRRDPVLEREEAAAAEAYMRNVGRNEADERP